MHVIYVIVRFGEIVLRHIVVPHSPIKLWSLSISRSCVSSYKSKKERIKFALMFPHSVNAFLYSSFSHPPSFSFSFSARLRAPLPASSAVSQGGSVAPGQTYASFHCTNPNAAWRNNCSSGRGFAEALSLAGSRQPGTRHFNQVSLSLSLYQTQTFYQTRPSRFYKHISTPPPPTAPSLHVVVAVRSSYLERHLH